VKELPPIIRRAPAIFYGLAVLFFVASFVLTVREISLTTGYPDADDPLIVHAKLRGLYQAALEALYIVANGVIAQILIAIWDRGIRREDGNGE
jgi:hypothetical protein